MNVLAELLLAHSQGFRQGGVAIQAGVRGLPICQARCEHDEAGQHETERAALNDRSLFRKIAIDTHTYHVGKSKDSKPGDPRLRA